MKTSIKNNTNSYRGFDLRSITWGYRDIFKKTIDGLFEKGLLKEEKDQSTEIFFELMRKSSAEHNCYNHILNNFLAALNASGNWIMKIPALFSDWTNLGTEFATYKAYMGLGYFKFWQDGGFGTTPKDVAYVLNKAREIKSLDMEFAFNFIGSYKKLSEKLSNEDIDVFMKSVLAIFPKNRENAYAFMRLETKTARLYADRVSIDARLEKIKNRLVQYAAGISGGDIHISDLSELDSDDLMERGSMVVALGEYFFLPAKSTYFPSKIENLGFYMLICATAASCLCFDSFTTIHGKKDASTSELFLRNGNVENPRIINNCFVVCETFRVLSRMTRFFPGCLNSLSRMSREDIACGRSNTPADIVMREGLKKITNSSRCDDENIAEIIDWMDEVALNSNSFVDTIDAVSAECERAPWIMSYFKSPSAPLSFFPDFMFPASFSTLPESACAVDIADSKRNKDNDDDKFDSDDSNKSIETKTSVPNSKQEDSDKENGKPTNTGVTSGYLYDEWNYFAKDYLQNWCCLREKTTDVKGDNELNPEYTVLSKAVKRVFEKLKPEEIRKEKRLSEGDGINIDLLTDYLSARKAKIFDKERFYEKPFVNKRDLTVAILMDMSGSTGEEVADGKKVIDLEKESAYILAEGLAKIGDRFGVYGFSGSGRGNAEYYIFKEFSDKWCAETQQALLSAYPRTSTRIGVALRHTGKKLSNVASKKKLILVITDGKPMDAEYDHSNRYAQHDIRKANMENMKNGIDSFCISTEDNELEDIDIMFPNRHFMIIHNMRDLPKTLSRVYLKLT